VLQPGAPRRVDAAAVHRRELHGAKELPPGGPEDGLDGWLHAVVGEDAVDLALQARADAHQRVPRTRQAPALADLDRSLQLDPRLAAAYLVRGNLHQSCGRTEEARRDYQNLRALDPKPATRIPQGW
jgi:tetratricopeptide (TPR) repeat protein